MPHLILGIGYTIIFIILQTNSCSQGAYTLGKRDRQHINKLIKYQVVISTMKKIINHNKEMGIAKVALLCSVLVCLGLQDRVA